jgi:CSLREA domain-containing protein
MFASCRFGFDAVSTGEDAAAADRDLSDAAAADVPVVLEDAAQDAGAEDAEEGDALPEDAAEDAAVDGGGADAAPLNSPPIARMTVSPGAGVLTTAFDFSGATSSDREEDPATLQYGWDFDGDGVLETSGRDQSRTFAEEGLRAVTLCATDGGGLIGCTVGFVMVAPASELIVVTTAADTVAADGDVSLREAIEMGNVLAGPNTITFEQGFVILLSSDLPSSGPGTGIYGRPGVVVDGQNIAVDCIDLSGSFNTVMWVEVRNCTEDGISMGSGQSNWVAHSKVTAIGRNGITVSGPGALVGPRNDIGLCGDSGLDVNSGATDGIAYVNLIHDNLGEGVSLQGPTDFQVRLNMLWNNKTGVKLEGATGARILHNTIHRNVEDALYFDGSSGSSADVRNNVISENGSGMAPGPTDTFIDLSNNLYFGAAGMFCQGCPPESGALFVDPAFVDAATWDLRLSAVSPCIDQGTNTGVDANGPRPGLYDGAAPDIGAFESP